MSITRCVASCLRHLAKPLLANLVLMAVIGWLSGNPIGILDPAIVPQAGLDRHNFAAFAQIVTLAWLIDRIIIYMLTRVDAPLHQQPVPKIGRYFISALIYLGFLSAALKLVFFQDLQTIFAASGILSLVVGFALRGLVSDVFSGVAMHAEVHVKPGDWLEVKHRGDELTARLLEFDWRCAVLEDRYKSLILIPNGEFSQCRIRNLSNPVAQQRLSVELEVAIEHDHVEVCEILANACAQVAERGHVLASPPPEVRISSAAQGVARVAIWYFVAPGASQTSSRHALLDACVGFLKAAGVPLKRYEHHTVGAADTEDLQQCEVRERILRQVPFFAILDASQVAVLAQRTLPRRMLRSEVLLRAGDPGDSMFLVLQGGFGVEIEVDGKTLHVATLWPRDILGEMSLFTGAPRGATVIASGPSTVLEIGKAVMAELLEKDTGLAEAFARLIVARQSANRKAAEDSRKPVAQVAEEQRTLLMRIASFFGLGGAGMFGGPEGSA